MKLEDKGPVAPAPGLEGALAPVAAAVASWPGVTAHAHWDLVRRDRMDGVDYYLADEEIGHLHFDGEAHIATDRRVADALIAEGCAEPFRYRADPGYAGWCQVTVRTAADASRAIEAFRRNHRRLADAAAARGRS